MKKIYRITYLLMEWLLGPHLKGKVCGKSINQSIFKGLTSDPTIVLHLIQQLCDKNGRKIPFFPLGWPWALTSIYQKKIIVWDAGQLAGGLTEF